MTWSLIATTLVRVSVFRNHWLYSFFYNKREKHGVPILLCSELQKQSTLVYKTRPEFVWVEENSLCNSFKYLHRFLSLLLVHKSIKGAFYNTSNHHPIKITKELKHELHLKKSMFVKSSGSYKNFLPFDDVDAAIDEATYCRTLI